MTMWHVGFDSIERYADERFEVACEDFQGEWFRAYSKQFQDEDNGNYAIRIERQEYPRKSVRQAVEDKMSRLLGGMGGDKGA